MAERSLIFIAIPRCLQLGTYYRYERDEPRGSHRRDWRRLLLPDCRPRYIPDLAKLDCLYSVLDPAPSEVVGTDQPEEPGGPGQMAGS